MWSADSTDSANLTVVGNYGPRSDGFIDPVDFGIRSLQPVHPENYLALMDYATHITAIDLHTCLRRGRSVEINVPDNAATWDGKGTTIVTLVEPP
jgi:hypothetical protein